MRTTIKKAFRTLLLGAVFALGFIGTLAVADDITPTGISQYALYTYLNNVKSLANENKADIARIVKSVDILLQGINTTNATVSGLVSNSNQWNATIGQGGSNSTYALPAATSASDLALTGL